MKNQIKWLNCFIFAVTILSSGSPAFAGVPSVQQLESQFETQLNTRTEPYGQPKATSYYDDLVDHYAQTLIMSDMIDKSIL